MGEVSNKLVSATGATVTDAACSLAATKHSATRYFVIANFALRCDLAGRSRSQMERGIYSAAAACAQPAAGPSVRPALRPCGGINSALPGPGKSLRDLTKRFTTVLRFQAK